MILLDETGTRQCEVLPPDPMLWPTWNERVGLHQLRHAMVTDLLANGASLREVQDIIGDKTGTVVLSVYAHSTIEQHAAAMQALEDERRRVQSLYKNDEPQAPMGGF